MEKLNVCLMNDSFPPAIDGVANAVTNYARVISDRLGRASVVTPYYPEADDSAFPFPVLRYPSLDVMKLVGYRAGLPFDAETMGRMEKQRFDIIHSHCPISSTVLARALRDRIDVPVVLTYHTKFDIDIANAVRGEFLREEAARFLVRNIAACDEVWTVSRGAGDNLRKLGYEGDYIVMPNGVDLPRGRVGDDAIEKAVTGYDLPAGVPVFLFVGRMMWYKGARITLDALKKLDAAGQDFRMVFVGSGADREEIMAYSSSLGLDGKVLFAPAIRDREVIRAWYCRADLFLFPSTFDTNGLVVREAAACGLGSVLVAGSCAAEDVTDGVNGILMEENAGSMAEKLTAVCADLGLARRIGGNAQRDLYISWEDAVKNAYERYGTVIDNYRRGLYQEHDRLTDGLLHGLASAMDGVNRGRERYRHMQEEITSGVEEVRESLADGFGDLREELTDGLEELKDGLSDGAHHLKDRLEELGKKMER